MPSEPRAFDSQEIIFYSFSALLLVSLSMLLRRRLVSDAERKLISRGVVDGPGTGTGTEADNLTPKQRRRAQVRKAQMYVGIPCSTASFPYYFSSSQTHLTSPCYSLRFHIFIRCNKQKRYSQQSESTVNARKTTSSTSSKT